MLAVGAVGGKVEREIDAGAIGDGMWEGRVSACCSEPCLQLCWLLATCKLLGPLFWEKGNGEKWCDCCQDAAARQLWNLWKSL